MAAHLGRLIDEDVPGRRGLEAWRALLEAHATLMRQLQTDHVNKTGLDLNDFARSCRGRASRALTM